MAMMIGAAASVAAFPSSQLSAAQKRVCQYNYEMMTKYEGSDDVPTANFLTFHAV